jgi:hypothetical protein
MFMLSSAESWSYLVLLTIKRTLIVQAVAVKNFREWKVAESSFVFLQAEPKISLIKTDCLFSN